MKYTAERDMLVDGHYIFAGEEYEIDEPETAPAVNTEEPSVTAPSVTPKVRHIAKRRSAKAKAKPKAKAPVASVEQKEQETLTLQEQ